MTAIRHAERLLSSDVLDDEYLDSHCTDHYVAAYEGLCRLLLGQHDSAVRALEGVLATWPGNSRQDEVLCRAWLAEAYVAAGRKPEAGAQALHALELVQATGSVRAGKALSSLSRSLASDDLVPEVGRFLAAHQVVAAPSRR